MISRMAQTVYNRFSGATQGQRRLDARFTRPKTTRRRRSRARYSPLFFVALAIGVSGLLSFLGILSTVVFAG